MSVFHKDSKSKDLDGWIGRSVKAVLNSESCFYEGILLEEQKNGIMIECSGKKSTDKIGLSFSGLVKG